MKRGILPAFVLIWVSGVAFAESAASNIRAVYTSGVEERQPVDQFTTLPKDLARVYFFTEVNNMKGNTISHRWQYGGKTVFEVPFEVKAARWRVWSSKEIQPGVSGEWTVVVVDGSGKELHRATLTVGQ